MTDDQIKFITPIVQNMIAAVAMGLLAWLAAQIWRSMKSLIARLAPNWAANKNGFLIALRHTYLLAFFAYMLNPLVQLQSPTGWEVFRIVFWSFFMLLYLVRTFIDKPASAESRKDGK